MIKIVMIHWNHVIRDWCSFSVWCWYASCHGCFCRVPNALFV